LNFECAVDKNENNGVLNGNWPNKLKYKLKIKIKCEIGT